MQTSGPSDNDDIDIPIPGRVPLPAASSVGLPPAPSTFSVSYLPAEVSSEINNNSASSRGGGLYIQNSALSLNNLVISGNTSETGGGLSLHECNDLSILLDNLLIEGNSASHGGGGVYMSGASPNVTNVAILDNNASIIGAGVWFDDDSNPIFSNVTFANNVVDSSTTYGGGAIACYHGADPIIINSILWNRVYGKFNVLKFLS